ncbi:hypothetical protein IAD21_03117 [Abditibacteriota bacterium]|nr:hypothetical protein IAD21_03117 [Abditibacteriota bacterium]
MKKYWRLFLILFATSTFAPSFAQADDKYADYAFVIFETTVTREGIETSNANPEERRFYVSNVVAFPEDDPAVFRRASKIADEYFTATVVEPMKAKGILHQYYDDGVRINNNVVYGPNGRGEVEDLRKKTLEELKEQTGNTFTFNWTRTEKPNGLETSKPALYHRNEEEPLYGVTEAPPTVPTPPDAPKTPGTPKTPDAPLPNDATKTPVVPTQLATPKPTAAPTAPTTLKRPVMPKPKQKTPLKTPVKPKPKVAKLPSQSKKVVKKTPLKK